MKDSAVAAVATLTLEESYARTSVRTTEYIRMKVAYVQMASMGHTVRR